MEERPWPTWRGGFPMTARDLARLLGPFGIHSKVIRVGDKTPRGYEANDFQDAWTRYLPPYSAEIRNIRNKDERPNAHAELACCGSSVSEPPCCGSENDAIDRKQSDVAHVADSAGIAAMGQDLARLLRGEITPEDARMLAAPRRPRRRKLNGGREKERS